MNDTLTIRAMTPDDLERAVGWAAAEGWNPGIDDAAAFYAADPTGYFTGWLGEEPAGCISVVKYGPAFAFLGLYIVQPAFRGQGHGIAIWNAGLASIGDRTIGLDGVVAQQDNYRKSGFVLAHNNVRYGGTVSPRPSADAALQPIDGDLIEAVIAYDRGFFPGERAGFITNWLLGAPSRQGLALVSDGAVHGYGAIRACGRGHKIGPLFAADAATAERLLHGLIRSAGATEVYLDVPEPNRAAVALATALGLEPVFETARMYRGPAPDLPLDRIFGITTFELG